VASRLEDEKRGTLWMRQVSARGLRTRGDPRLVRPNRVYAPHGTNSEPVGPRRALSLPPGEATARRVAREALGRRPERARADAGSRRSPVARSRSTAAPVPHKRPLPRLVNVCLPFGAAHSRSLTSGIFLTGRRPELQQAHRIADVDHSWGALTRIHAAAASYSWMSRYSDRWVNTCFRARLNLSRPARSRSRAGTLCRRSGRRLRRRRGGRLR
jgi:hypothetical protein